MTRIPISELREQVQSGAIDADSALRQVELLLGSGDTAELLIARAHFIQLGDGHGYELDDARRSYEEAYRLDPEKPETLIELGHFFYAVMSDELTAEMYFRRALELGGGEECRRMLDNIVTGEIGLD